MRVATTRGIQIYEAIQARYPFSDLSRQIQLEMMYAYYKAGQKEQAVEAADALCARTRFIRESITRCTSRAWPTLSRMPAFSNDASTKMSAPARRKMLICRTQSFRRLVERYPASEYAPDAEQRMIFIKNRLSAYENHVADYYLRRGAYVAALNRANKRSRTTTVRPAMSGHWKSWPKPTTNSAW